MLILSGSPKARVLAACPKAVCKRENGYGQYVITFGCEVRDFNGRPITSLRTGTGNPADAWEYAAIELRLPGTL
jgi:hypothetical protein